MTITNSNERSWAIDLISDINIWLTDRDIAIKRAGGENTLRTGSNSMFPDVLLFGDLEKGKILQGWELKMPDTPIDDVEFIKNAKDKAILLSLNSFLLWNMSTAVLYKIDENENHIPIKNWNRLSYIKTREEVTQNKAQIHEVLIEILNDLSQFILDGTVKSTSVVTSLTSEIVSELIQNNLGSYVDSLKRASVQDCDFSDEITLWWRYAKIEYPEETDKFKVLGRNNLLSLINKFLFAHILKSYQIEANKIDVINSETDIVSALDIFNQISEKCDFWNIFQNQKGEKYVTQDVWQDILSFNDLLKEFSFAKIEKALLHDLIDLTVYKNKRKFAGQFTTPQELAKLAVALTIRDTTKHTIDPCCGTGTIAREIYNAKKTVIGVDKSLETLWASDKFSLPLQMAMFNLADPEALGILTKIFNKDATKLLVGENIEFHEPFKGNAVIEKLPKFGYIISNLPFVQQEDLEFLNPDILKINEEIIKFIGTEYALDGRSDLYAYLPFYFWNLLETNGKITIIISNSWLGTAWGLKFYNSLSGFFYIENIVISGNGRWFGNAKVVTNIITLRKRERPDLPEDSEIIKFTVTKKALSEYTQENIDEITAIVSSKTMVNEDDLCINSYSHQKIKEIQSLGLNLNSFFADNSWLLELSDKLVKISDFFNVGRGERRGWDNLFFPESGNQIESEYLKPVLKTPRSIKNLIAKPDAVAFCCKKTKDELIKLEHKGALEWIEKFEGQVNEKGIPLPISLARSGINWYTMLPATMAEMVTGINFGDRLFFARFDEPTFVNQRLVRFSVKSPDVDSKLCHALMNSLISLFYIEAMGTGRGEGALDLSKDKFENDLRIINPNLINDQDREKILTLFQKIETRKILPIQEELEQKDRKEFDGAVLAAIGCVSYGEKIKESLLSLYKIRTAVIN
ncbi:MAG: N-6 DNA methylase [Candidatus Paceibacterota bacterium]